MRIMDPSSSSLVLSIDCLKGTSKADEWTADMLQTGDVVDELRIGKSIFRAPFRNGKSGVQRILHRSFKQKETSIRIRVTRGSESFVELQACIVPDGRKGYALRSIDDPNYAVGFVDRTDGDCRSLQASRRSRMLDALEQAPLQDGYVSYPWRTKMIHNLQVPSSRTSYSILFLPKSSNNHFHDLDDTLARAQAWFQAAHASTAPIVFLNVQTESLITKVSGDIASSSAGSLSSLGNTSLYGFEDYHGVDVGVIRGVRLWFSPIAGEVAVGISIGETDTKLGFTISRTEEGFIYISSVIDDEGDGSAPAWRSGLSSLFKQAASASRLLVVSRISNRKVVPWMVSPAGVIRCYDAVSLSRKLSLHRHNRMPIVLHLFVWDKNVNCVNAGTGSIRPGAMAVCPLPLPLPAMEMDIVPPENVEENWADDYEINLEDGGDDICLEKDSTGEFSFRFRDFGPTDNWV